jgi:hypothetical protein
LFSSSTAEERYLAAKGSQLLSLTRYEFIQRASELGIPYFRFTEQELKDEIHQSEPL